MIGQLLYLNIGAPERILLVITLFLLVYFCIAIFCLVDITRSRFRDPINKVIWTLIVLAAPFLGVLFYLIFGRQQKILNS